MPQNLVLWRNDGAIKRGKIFFKLQILRLLFRPEFGILDENRWRRADRQSFEHSETHVQKSIISFDYRDNRT